MSTRTRPTAATQGAGPVTGRVVFTGGMVAVIVVVLGGTVTVVVLVLALAVVLALVDGAGLVWCDLLGCGYGLPQQSVIARDTARAQRCCSGSSDARG
jgi:hypothetical protein